MEEHGEMRYTEQCTKENKYSYRLSVYSSQSTQNTQANFPLTLSENSDNNCYQYVL